LEAEDAWFERSLLDEFCHIAERAGFHRSNFLSRIDVDEDGDSIAHNEYCEHFVFIGCIDTGALAPSDTSICALAASAFDPSLPDVRVDQESSGCGGGRPVYELAQTLHEKAKAPCW
jgi:hypothetical protein